jgi:hypothetical protein
MSEHTDDFPIHHQLTGFYNRDGVFTARYGRDLSTLATTNLPDRSMRNL